MSDRERHIREFVLVAQKILWEQWDPIGVNKNEQCYGEYDDYAPLAAKLAIQDDKNCLLLYLASARLGSMGLRDTEESYEVDLAVALELIRRAKEILDG